MIGKNTTDGFKACAKCGEIHPMSSFYCGSQKTILEACSGCRSKASHERYKRNIPARRQRQIENRDAYNEWSRKNREKFEATATEDQKAERSARAAKASRDYRERHLAACQERQRLYRQRNPHKIAEYRVKYKEAVSRAHVDWADDDEIRDIYLARDRAKAESGIDFAVDHIIPLTNNKVCGLHVLWNLRIVTKSENSKKHNSFRQEDALAPDDYDPTILAA